MIMRDGTVQTHGNFRDPQVLCLEGPIDPEVAILAARNRRKSPATCARSWRRLSKAVLSGSLSNFIPGWQTRWKWLGSA